MTQFMGHVKRFVKSEEGATMVEYGLMLALIAIVAMAGAALIGTSTNTLFNTTANTL
jgi:pilus assembly protein Flp/PilA